MLSIQAFASGGVGATGSRVSLQNSKVGDVVSVKAWNGETQSYVKMGDNRFAAVKDGKLYSMEGHHNMYSIADSNSITGVMNASLSRGVSSKITIKSGVYTESQLTSMKMEAQGIRMPRRPNYPTRGK